MLKFETLRAANIARLPTFRNARGELAHPPPADDSNKHEPGDDWALSQWSNATTGELGEAANIVKKLERGDYDLDTIIADEKTGEKLTVRAALAKELADVICYADLWAKRARIDLGAAVVEKFNEISARVGSPISIVPTVDGGLVYDARTDTHSEATP